MNIAPWFFLEVDWSEVDVIFVGVLGDWLYLIICAPLFGLFVHFFYGNNAPLRYALYWSSRGLVEFNNLCFPFRVVRPLFLMETTLHFVTPCIGVLGKRTTLL
ncbi:hypothetical protein D3B60_12120 [Listeria monocytogenes]|nr:hypothetical protein [Listeria monocytogenes]EAD9144683.1 hypothetical protein [Listeria monocytogenes]MDA29215.1 hypothetical protein [Listeria monocytogenes]MDB50370.1 hypothetical protein [Listeria monocytogenes]MDC30926.1 hypothetical protein [Listeria monocytogenes]